MSKCPKCGRKGLFLKLTDGLCTECNAVVLNHQKCKTQPEIIYSTDSARKFDLTQDELVLLEALESGLKSANKSPYCKITRMATGALSVNSSRAYLGKIKLQGRKTWMQYMAGLYSSEMAEDKTLSEYIHLLRYWIKSA